jgi:uncharacterized membrane protein YsdA (DUF1294 family)
MSGTRAIGQTPVTSIFNCIMLLHAIALTMSELDKKKAELAFWEKVFFASFAAVFGLAGWFSANYKTADVAFLIASSVAFVFAVLVVIVTYRKVQNVIHELGGL